MTRRDYVLLAATMHECCPGRGHEYYDCWLANVRTLSEVLKRENSNFDSDRFVRACKGEQGAGV
jgi:hypothetical protein